MSEQKKQHGILISGVVIAKNNQPENKERKQPEKFYVQVAIPGMDNLLSIRVPKALYDSVEELQNFKTTATFNFWNNKLYWNAV